MPAESATLYTPIKPSPVKTKDGVVVLHKVPARDEPRSLLKVNVMPSNGIVVAGQHVLTGISMLVVYDSELPAVEARVASPAHIAAWKRAEAVYASQLEAHVNQETGTKPGPMLSEQDRMSRQRSADRYGKSTVSELFAQEYPGGMPPILDLEILESVEPPETEITRERKRNADNAQIMAEAFASAMAKHADKLTRKSG